MKKSKLFLAALASLITSSMASKTYDDMVFAEDLPTDAKSFVQKFFPRHSVAFAEMDIRPYNSEYKVSLNDGTEINFNFFGEWSAVDCKFNAVPLNIVPDAIAQCADHRFPDSQIVAIHNEEFGYKVKLSSDITLTFNQHGELV